MKFNGAIFSKPQQDQLKGVIGNELDAVVEKVKDVDARMLNYAGDWVSGNEYHENDVVTWGQDGHLYEVIKAHTSSVTFDPDNPDYYKAMTSKTWQIVEFPTWNSASRNVLFSIVKKNADALIRILFEGAPAYVRVIKVDDDSCKIGGVVNGINTTTVTSIIHTHIVRTAEGSAQYFTGFGVGTDGTITPINQRDIAIQAVIYTA